MTLPGAQIWKIAILLVLIAALGGCSSTRLIYAFAGGFIQDEVAYFLDLDEEEDDEDDAAPSTTPEAVPSEDGTEDASDEAGSN